MVTVGLYRVNDCYAKIIVMPTSLKFRMPKGFGLIEIVIAAAIIGATIFSLYSVFVLATKLESQSANKVRANFLAEEGLEALRHLRDRSWSASLAPLSAGNDYYISFIVASSTWRVSQTNPGLVDSLLTRKITVENINRDGSFNIVSSGGVLDPDTKKINVEISWPERGATSTIKVSTYLANMFNN